LNGSITKLSSLVSEATINITSNSATDSTTLSMISSPISISAPLLNPTTLNTWAAVSATVVNSIVSNTINNVNQLPQVMVAGISNTNAVINTINSQSSILLNIVFPPLTSGTTIISAIGLPNYTLPNSTSVATIIPTVVTTVNPTSGQVIATPPFDKIIPGQKMIIPVTNSVIPSFGGLKEIDVQSSPTATSTGGTAPDEWFVAEVDNKLPSSISSSSIKGTIFLFVNIQYPFEDNGVGFNWGDPHTHAKPPTLTLVVNKTSQSFIQNDSQGCPIIDAYTLSSGAWTQNGLGEIFSSSISPTQCQITIQSQHLSKFAFSLRHISSLQSSGPGLFGVGTVANSLTSASLAGSLDNGTIDTATAVTSLLNTVTSFYKTIADPAEGFSNVECSQGSGFALMTGQYTSGAVPNKVVFLKMSLLDNTGHVLSTGNGDISDIDAHKTKSFNAIARFNDNFTSCTVQVDTTIPK